MAVARSLPGHRIAVAVAVAAAERPSRPEFPLAVVVGQGVLVGVALLLTALEWAIR
jgi:hypothetical protein